MKTAFVNKNRYVSENETIDSKVDESFHSLLWHITLYNTLSTKDCDYLNSLLPDNCSLFVLKNDSTIFHSVSLQNDIQKIKSTLQFSYEATYSQNLNCDESGMLRILTIPLDNNLLIGLVSQVGIRETSTIEDSFLHHIHQLQKEYSFVKNHSKEMRQILNQNDPVIVINRSDNQIIGWNDIALLFFKLPPQKLIEMQLEELQTSSSITALRKLQLNNRTIGNSDCSVITYSQKETTIDTKTIFEQLMEHTQFLLNQYNEIKGDKKINKELIEVKLEELHICSKNLNQLHNKK